MTNEAHPMGRRGPNRWRVAGWGIAAGLVLLPLVAMQFTKEVNWTAGDFLFAILLIGGVGLAFELVVRTTRSIAYRAGAAAALAATFLTVWANGAVGMIGSEDNRYNLFFFGAIAVALAGSAIAGFRARGMAITMLAAGLLHAGVGLFGMSADLRGGIFATAFAGIWLFSAALFRTAARDG